MKNNLTLTIIVLSTLSLIYLIPYIILILSCFSTSASIKGNTVIQNISIQNFIDNLLVLFHDLSFLQSLANSLIISLGAAVIGVFVSSIAGYAYVIYNNKISNVFFLISISTIMIPTIALLVPTFLIFKLTSLLDTYLAVILTSMSIPFLIYLFKQNTLLFPMELIHIARIDGLSELSIFFKIYVPLMLDVFIASIMISFFNAWNSVIMPVVLLQSPTKFTTSIYLNSLGSFWAADYGVIMLAILFSTLPIIIIFLIFKRAIIKTLVKIV